MDLRDVDDVELKQLVEDAYGLSGVSSGFSIGREDQLQWWDDKGETHDIYKIVGTYNDKQFQKNNN